MIKPSSDADRVLVAKINEAAQGQIFAHWDHLGPEEQEGLLEQARSLDLPLIRKLVAQYLQGSQEVLEGRVITPAPLIQPARGSEAKASEEKVQEAGEEALRKGRIGILTAAGEMGSYDSDRPKGLYPVGPVSGKTLFRLHAEKIRATSRKYRTALPWIVGTSAANQEAVAAHFKENDFFGLNRSDVHFLSQEQLPVVNLRGKILLSQQGRIAMSPNGHGGVLQRLLAPDPFDGLEARGLEQIFYFQVDNPLVRIADPAFIGHHILQECDVTSKAVCRNDPDEKVGIFCRTNGTLGVIEHRELSEEDRVRRGSDGRLEFCAANVGIHVFSMAFLRRLRESGMDLSYHFAQRKTPYLDRKGSRTVPRQVNSIQFVTFIFDVLTLARNTLVVEADREEEFSPVKNISGRDSIATAKRDLSRLWTGWLREAGANVPGDPTPVEISPLYALDSAELKTKLETALAVRPGLYLE